MRYNLRLNEVMWVQEEPRNAGARAHMFPRLMQIMPEGIHFGFIGRPERASPGEGYPAAHLTEQNRIVTTAIELDQHVTARSGNPMISVRAWRRFTPSDGQVPEDLKCRARMGPPWP